MSDRVKFLMTFRARLMVLLTSFLLITIILVIVLDNWARKRADAEVARQRQEVAGAVEVSYSGLAEAMGLALRSLDSEQYLYEVIKPGELPPTVETIIVTEKDGMVHDSTLKDLVNAPITIPQEEVFQIKPEDPVRKEDEFHEDKPLTYYIPIRTAKGLYWIVIVTTQQALVSKIEVSSTTLANTNRTLSNYRLLATAGLLMLALAIAVIFGWRFTQPIK
ncbi:MAG TPA: hypothetical protein VNO70_11825, partial [Blastocatellia bacterium]|nr:hypothetical protein [Blastocatellia bacterium]